MKIDMHKTGEAISLEIIENTGKRMNVLFPDEYIQFLLDQNGGYPIACEFQLPDLNGSSVVNEFFSIGNMSMNLEEANDYFDDDAFDDYITIGDDPGGNNIILKVKGDKIGSIYYLNHEVSAEQGLQMYFLANNMNEFLKQLK